MLLIIVASENVIVQNIKHTRYYTKVLYTEHDNYIACMLVRERELELNSVKKSNTSGSGKEQQC